MATRKMPRLEVKHVLYQKRRSFSGSTVFCFAWFYTKNVRSLTLILENVFGRFRLVVKDRQLLPKGSRSKRCSIPFRMTRASTDSAETEVNAESIVKGTEETSEPKNPTEQQTTDSKPSGEDQTPRLKVSDLEIGDVLDGTVVRLDTFFDLLDSFYRKTWCLMASS